MFFCKKSFEEIMLEYMTLNAGNMAGLDIVLPLYTAKVSYCMKDFFLIMDKIIEVEMRNTESSGVECYTILPNELGELIWVGYENSGHILHKEKNPNVDFSRHFKVVIIRDNNGPEKKLLPLIYFLMDSLWFDATAIYFGMAEGNLSFMDIVTIVGQN